MSNFNFKVLEAVFCQKNVGNDHCKWICTGRFSNIHVIFHSDILCKFFYVSRLFNGNILITKLSVNLWLENVTKIC